MAVSATPELGGGGDALSLTSNHDGQESARRAEFEQRSRAAGFVLVIAGIFGVGVFALLALDLLSNVPIELLEWPVFIWNLGLPIFLGIGQLIVGNSLRRGDTSPENIQWAIGLSLGVVLSHVVFVWQDATSRSIPLTEYWQEVGHVVLSGIAAFLVPGSHPDEPGT